MDVRGKERETGSKHELHFACNHFQGDSKICYHGRVDSGPSFAAFACW